MSTQGRRPGDALAWRDAWQRGMWPEGLVAALACIAVALPLGTLLREDDWLPPAVAMVVLVALTGAVLRTIDLPASLVSVGQLLLGVAGVVGLYLRDTLTFGVLPTLSTLERSGDLLRQAGKVLQTYAAPAPTTEGVSFLVVAVITLTAVSVDSMGVTGRAPASAGIPLAAAFLVSVSNTGRAMEPWFFAAVAGLWLVMVAQQGQRVTRAWPSPDRQTSRGGSDVGDGPRVHRGLAQALGAGALVAAVLGAAVLPHLPPMFFTGGMARNPEARTTGPQEAGEVSFTESMDPTRDLRNRSQAPVLTYRTNALSLQPLRVTATERYEDGAWVAPERRQAGLLPAGAPLPGPEGVAEDVSLAEYSLEVLGNELTPPHLAAPSPLTALDLPAGRYRYDPSDSTVVLQDRAPRYSLTFVTPTPGAALPEHVGERPADPADFDPELLAVDPVSEPAVAALSEEVVGGTTNALQAAILMQEHLRDQQVWTYSLDLAPAARVGASDPITAFIETRQGYCVQFAQTMVMMARHEGIPARMAVGFLPGSTQPDGTRQVRAADAHTWPELWIDGMGWTRFEPTPGARVGASPPPYTRAEPTDSAPTTSTVTRTVAPTRTEQPSAAPAPAQAQEGLLDDVLQVLGRLLPVVLVLALLMLVVPVLGRRHREAQLRRATTPAERVEGQWTLLTRSLEDLGMAAPPRRSPRGMREHYEKLLEGGHTAHQADGGGQEALGRVTATLERSRYAAPGALTEDDASAMGQDVRAVVQSARRGSPWNIRANASLLPRSGLQGLGRIFRRG